MSSPLRPLFPGLAVHGLDLRLRVPAPLPRGIFPGNTLRGLLGHGLHRRVCIHPGAPCGPCALASDCAYPRTFKPLSEGELPGFLLHRWQPAPDSLQHFHLTLHLIGPHVACAEDWLRGLYKVLPELAWFNASGLVLDEARCSAGQRKVFGGGLFQPAARLAPLELAHIPPGPVKLQLLSPLVSKHGGQDPFYPALRTRLQRLLNTFGEEMPLPKDAPWRVVDEDWRPVTHRLNAGRTLPGLSGHQVLDDISPEGRLILAFGQQVHAGGQATLGCGRYTVEACQTLRPPDRPA